MRVSIFLLSFFLLHTSCSHVPKNQFSEAEASDFKRNATANCRVLDTFDNSLHPLKRVDQTQRFETQVGDIRAVVTLEDPFIVSHDNKSTVFRWRYGLLSPETKFEFFHQETYLSGGLASFGEFFVVFSAHRPPNYELHIASFQDRKGRSVRLYCMTTIMEVKSKKEFSLEKANGRYYRSNIDLKY